MHRHGLALACIVALTGGSRAASPNPEDLAISAELQVKTRALVRQLGSEDYREREDAQEQLADLGRLARPALFAGATTSPDPEIRFRCAQLLPRAAKLDIKARLETFLADTEGQYEHDLPAWKTFRATVCNEWSFFGYSIWSDRSLENTARQMFVDLISTPANRRLLLAIDGSRLELTELVVGRKLELYDGRFPRGETTTRTATLDDVAALLFADSRVGSQYLPRRGSIASLLNSTGFTQAARGSDEKGRVYRAIAAAWLNSRNEPREMYQAMNLAMSLELTDSLCGLSAKLLTMPSTTPMFRGRGADNLATWGTKRHIPLLEKSLTDAVVVYTVRAPALPGGESDAPTYELQVRDIALAVSILLASQKPEDFGFVDRYAAGPGENRSYSYTRYYFTDEATRKKALAKWLAWRKAHADD